MKYEFPKQNATTKEIKEILQNSKTIEVVKLSNKEHRDSFQ